MKRIVIIGATSGIGLKVAEIYAEAGWMVGVAGRNEEVMTRLAEKYKNVIWEKIDVTHRDASSHLKKLIGNLGGMDIYFHVAGVYHQNPSLRFDKEEDILRTNVIGFARLTVAAFKYFRYSNNGKGQIAAITSVAGTKGIGELAAYSASKRFQQNYLQALEQLANIYDLKICFTDIRPGWTRTPLLDSDRSYPLSMSIDEVAPLVVRAIRTRKRVSVIDRKWAILTSLWRLIPSPLWVKIPLKVSSQK